MRRLDRFTCEEVFRRLDDMLDHELSPDEEQLVREHLDVCLACADEYHFEAGVLRALKEKLQRARAPESLLNRISRALAAEAA